MDILNLLLPDFSLIALGVLVYRISNWGDEFWAGMEKLVYFLLFPALLFYSTARLKVDLSVTGGMVQTGVLSLLAGIIPVLIATLIGTAIGAAAAYFGGLIEAVLMRIMDVSYAFPALLINWSSRLMCRCWAGMSWF